MRCITIPSASDGRRDDIDLSTNACCLTLYKPEDPWKVSIGQGRKRVYGGGQGARLSANRDSPVARPTHHRYKHVLMGPS